MTVVSLFVLAGEKVEDDVFIQGTIQDHTIVQKIGIIMLNGGILKRK